MKYRYLLIFLSILLSCSDSFSQIKTNFEIGYGIGTHTKTGGLDFVIGRYNATRSYLTTKMPVPHFFRGMNYAMDMYLPNGLMDFEWVSRKSDVTAEVASSHQGRDFRYKLNTFNFGFAVKTNKKKSGVMGSYLGLDFSTMSIKNYTRTFQTGSPKPEFTKINWDISLGFSPFVQFVGNRFTAKLYYQIMLLKVNYWDVNTVINPNTWYNDDYDKNKGRTSSLGFCLRYNLFKNNKEKVIY